MDMEEIRDLMTTTPLPLQDDSSHLVSMYADILEQLAPKLTQDELFSLIAVGTAFYQGARRQEEARPLTDRALRHTHRR
ncbi:hypothetical protein SB816_05790 [Achromobacter sp. SIMBA_011]|uniref:hypothetical protein n=1 Tax=Achromobacter TaxID=222 RepID=UPI0011A3CA9E|nr:hypothetical protein [Achromobacter dolens]MCZ8406349.1 hypothetical protein [Achromobacter dolens]CAB3644791.1 hypothetical protein LMG26840_02350 [Achromobacter dolens]